MANGKTFGGITKEYGGGIQVWRNQYEVLAKGGTIQDLPTKRPYLIPVGTPVEITSDGKAKLLNFYKATEAVLIDGTEVKLFKNSTVAEPVIGKAIMLAPTTLTGTGKAVLIDNVVDSDTFWTVTLHEALGVIAENALLCDAAEAGADVAAYAIPNALTKQDNPLMEADTAATAAGVARGTIFADRMPFHSDAVEAALPMIIFEKGI